MEIKHEQLWPLVHRRLREYMPASNWDFETIASRTASTSETVAGWLDGKEPNGERLIKLWHVLAASGCESPELNELGKPNVLCGQLLTFGILGMQELQEIIDVTNPQAVLRMLRGSDPMHWQHDYNELYELYGDQLKEAVAAISTIEKATTAKAQQVQVVPSVPVVERLASAATQSGNMPLYAASLLGAALPVVRYMISDDCSPQERSKLRTLMGEEGMFELSNHFNALCSERARNSR